MLVLLGVILLHLGANAIDDVFDYSNGVDEIANATFPADFDAWKPLPRKLITLNQAKVISGLLFLSSLAIGAFFWNLVGFWAFGLALAGTGLAIFYTAPPLKLDYLGYGLGELAIFFSFGPIPVLGAFYVETGNLTLNAFLLSIPIGLMTVTILVDHDLIFYEVYSKSKKMSLATILGRERALMFSLVATMISYLLVVGFFLIGIVQVYALLAPLFSALILARKSKTFLRPKEPPPFYVPFTLNGLFANWGFSLILALALLL